MKVVDSSFFYNYRRTVEEIDSSIVATVMEIVEDVRKGGDKALMKYTKKLDGVVADDFNILVSREEIDEARAVVEKTQKDVLACFLNAIENLKDYHRHQKENSYFYKKGGSLYGQMVKPIERVGVYVPGGKAFYPSSLVMNIVPAQIAGVNEIYLATPPNKSGELNPILLTLADYLGVKEVYKIGGAQAIAALAFGTETVTPVYKIVGPGNIYVALAKKMVIGRVGIDSIAGPSEVVVFADESANPEWLASDLAAQAEHTGDNTVILISNSKQILEKTEVSLSQILANHPRRELIEKSLSECSYRVLVKSYEEGFDIINKLAPEHVEVVVELDNQSVLDSIKNAGAIFLGGYTPVAAADYFAGLNHVIPTNGTAVFSSPLGVYDFVKRIEVLSLSDDYLKEFGADIAKMARFERLEAHAVSIEKRRD